MPKLIDHHSKKEWIAYAAWKVVLTQGFEGASVRNIAKEAGLSLGSLRYYFTTQEELMEFAELLVHARITEKIEEIFQTDRSPQSKILAVLYELLPESEKGGREIEVRLLFKMHSHVRNNSFDIQKDSVYIAAKNIMSNLVLLNLLKPEVNVKQETERLYSLLDGLALNAVTRADEIGKGNMKDLVILHMNTICKEKIGNLS